MTPSVPILQWLELLLVVTVAAFWAPGLTSQAWQPWRFRAPSPQQQLPARAATLLSSPEVNSELQVVQDRLAQASLAQFQRNNDLSRLEEARRQDLDRGAALRTRIDQLSRDLIASRDDRDRTSQEILRQQSQQDAVGEAQTTLEESNLAQLESQLADEDRASRIAQDRVRFLESLNYESDELTAARAASRDLIERRDRLAAQVESVRTDLRVRNLAADESRDWSLTQQRSDLYRNYDARVRQLQTQLSAAQDELDTLELRDEQNRTRVAELADEQRQNQQEMDALEARRIELLAQARSSPSPIPQRPS